jgi:16S rRNA (cytidine1402-2'-O)-methyltransferase
MISLNAVNESKKIIQVLDRLTKGETCALISDAGTPGISDPGVRLTSEALKNNVNVISVPGPSALTAALSVSGLPADSFVFEGFLPQKKGRQKLLKELSEEKRTIVLYESTYRIEKLLNELNNFMPDRYIVICRELTKKFEETWRGYPEDLIQSLDDKVIKGEFVVVISPKKWKVTGSSYSES